MKARAVLCCYLAGGVVTIVTAWLTGVPWALALCAMSFMPCMSLLGSQRLWQPWFMQGVTDDMPDLRILAIQAAILEALTIVGLCLHVGPTLLAFRLLGFMVQLSTLGKLSRDNAIPPTENEDSRTPATRRQPRDSRKS